MVENGNEQANYAVVRQGGSGFVGFESTTSGNKIDGQRGHHEDHI